MIGPENQKTEKQLYQRFWALQNDPELVEIFKRWGQASFRRSSVLEGLEVLINRTDFAGKRCVEIGTYKGLTAVVLSRYFEEVVTLDILPDDDKRAIAESTGRRNIRFIDVRDNAEKAKIVNGLEFDAAYVDGDHAHDTETDFSLVERCGRVLFHEYWPAQPPVWNLVNRLRFRGSVETEDKLALWTAR